MEKLEFVVMGQPMGWKRVARFGGHYYDPKENQNYKSMVRDSVYRAGFSGSPHEGLIKISGTFVFLRPKKYMTEVYPDGRFFKASTPDVDNLIKMVMDALNKYVFRDDGQVCQITSKKVYCAKENDGPRSEITITLEDD